MSALAANTKTRFLWSLPQPIYVLGFSILSATACMNGWIEPWTLYTWVHWLSFPALLLAERLVPRREDWALDWKDLLRDTFWVLATYLFWVPFYGDYYNPHIEGLFTNFREAIGLSFSLQANTYGELILSTLIALIAAEFIYYWAHRLQHRFMFFWRMHATHHHISKMSVGRCDRTHPLEFIGLMLGTAVIFTFLGASPEVVAVVVMFKNTTAHMNHANLPIRAGVFGWIFTTAESHQLHHSLNYKEGNQNFGCTVILWDRVFGTFSSKEDIDQVGNGSGKKLSLITQLLLPFYSNKTLREL